MPRTHDRDVLNTYRYLRAAMIALLVMLLFAVGYTWWWEMDHGCWLGSISGYYFTPTRPIFVGSLFGLGVSLIVYKGHSDVEDVLLNFSGFMAMVVALVPTTVDNTCGMGLDYQPSEEQLASLVRNGIWSLIFVAVLAAGVRWWLRRDLAPDPGLDKAGVWATVICAGVLVIELALFVTARASFIAVSHGVAAGTMVAGVIAVMVINALTVEDRKESVRDENPQPYKRWYAGLALTLTVALTVTVVASFVRGDPSHTILVAEAIIIVLFGAFWVVQSHELWNVTTEATDAETEGRGTTEVAS